MHRILVPASLLLVFCSVYGFAEERNEKQNTELAWVKRLVTEFFELALAVESKSDYSTPLTIFLTPELNAQLKEKPGECALAVMALQYPGGVFSLMSAEIAPNGNEVILNGVLAPRPKFAGPTKMKKDDEESNCLAALILGCDFGFGFDAKEDAKQLRQDQKADVTILVTKDTVSGLWVIRFIRIKVSLDEKSKLR